LRFCFNRKLCLDHQRVAVMQQAIENGGREDFVTEDAAPSVTSWFVVINRLSRS
jgi:hypothetical protein